MGAPGSGKSTLLYQLGRDLSLQATLQVTAPLPVLFPLSSWAKKRPPLVEWMVEQLSSALYRVPRQQSQQWVQQEQIVPLLDGLDEMDEATRPACISAINAYQCEYPLRPLVVCCRSEEYTAVIDIGQREGRLLLQNAVEVQLLSPAQLDATLLQAGKPVTALRSELKQNLELRDLARTPLWLNVLLLTFKDMPVRALSRQRSMLQQEVFAHYVQRQIEQKGNCQRYPLEQTKHWLSWLAGQMRAQNQTTFAIELLQPDWLTKRLRLYYYWSAVLLVVGVSAGLFFMLSKDLLIGLLLGSIYGLLEVIGLEMLGEPEIKKTPAEKLFTKIMLAETFTWSWKKSRSCLKVGLPGLLLGILVTGTGFVTVIWVGIKQREMPVLSGALMLSGTLIGVLVLLGLVFTLFGGLQLTQYIERDTLSPGEGLRRSRRNGLLTGLSAGLLTRPLAGLSAGLLAGLLPVIQHYILRFWLNRTHAFPFQVGAFLEDACACHLLKRVGGSYQFMHRLLLDYFADLERKKAAAVDRTKPTASESASLDK